MRKRFLAAGLLTVATFTGISGGAAYATNTPKPAPTIVGIVSASGGEFDNDGKDYDLLLTAVKAAGLVDALNDPAASLTVFAPRDSAFVLLARDLGYHGHDEAGAWGFLVNALTGLGKGDPIPVLKSVLLYHVAPGELDLFDVIWADTITTLGGTITVKCFRLVDADPDFKDARVTWPLNIKASNGIVHTITRVMLPINI